MKPDKYKLLKSKLYKKKHGMVEEVSVGVQVKKQERNYEIEESKEIQVIEIEFVKQEYTHLLEFEDILNNDNTFDYENIKSLMKACDANDSDSHESKLIHINVNRSSNLIQSKDVVDILLQ